MDVKVNTHEFADKVYQASFNHPYKLNICDVAGTRIPLHGLRLGFSNTFLGHSER